MSTVQLVSEDTPPNGYKLSPPTYRKSFVAFENFKDGAEPLDQNDVVKEAVTQNGGKKVKDGTTISKPKKEVEVKKNCEETSLSKKKEENGLLSKNDKNKLL